MNDDLSRDPLDDELARRLRSLSAGPDDTRSVLHAMRPRFVAAQRRRRAAIATSAALATMLVVGAAAALSGGGIGSKIETVPPAGQGASSTGPDRPILTDADGDPIPTDGAAGGPDGGGSGGTATTQDGNDPDDTDGGTTDSSPDGGSTPGTGSTPTTRPPTNTTGPPSGGTTTTPPVGPTTTTQPAPTTTTQPSTVTKTCLDPAGNSITVRWNGTELSLISASPASGWARNFDDDFASDEIRIEFESGANGYRIRGRWHNGAIECSWSTFIP